MVIAPPDLFCHAQDADRTQNHESQRDRIRLRLSLWVVIPVRNRLSCSDPNSSINYYLLVLYVSMKDEIFPSLHSGLIIQFFYKLGVKLRFTLSPTAGCHVLDLVYNNKKMKFPARPVTTAPPWSDNQPRCWGNRQITLSLYTRRHKSYRYSGRVLGFATSTLCKRTSGEAN